MKTVSFTIENLYSPKVLLAETNFLLVYKPPKMHSAPGKGESLAEWCGVLFPEILNLRRPGNSAKSRFHDEGSHEGGLLHRLDYETHGLVLFARNQISLEELLDEQNRGMIVKEYGALVSKTETLAPGFPPFPESLERTIESGFRPYGPGRKEVRPADDFSGKISRSIKISKDQGKPYRTEITENRFAGANELRYFRLRIYRGFRHQIRCHLAWAGFPVLNDPLYGEMKAGKNLALRAEGIEFSCPASGEKLHCVLPALDLLDL